MTIVRQMGKIKELYRLGGINLDKLIQLCFRSIVSLVNGDKELSKQYAELAMEEYKEHEDTIKVIYENKSHKNHKSKRSKGRCTYRVEDHIPIATKKRLYEMVEVAI